MSRTRISASGWEVYKKVGLLLRLLACEQNQIECWRLGSLQESSIVLVCCPSSTEPERVLHLLMDWRLCFGLQESGIVVV